MVGGRRTRTRTFVRVRGRGGRSRIEMQKNMFFFKPCFLCKKKSVFYRKKNSFLMFFLFFSITGRFLINYSAIRVYL